MRLKHRLEHALKKPPHILAWKVWQKTLQAARSRKYWDSLAGRQRRELADFTDRALLDRILSAPQILDVVHLGDMGDLLDPEVRLGLIEEADAVMGLKFSYLGWTRTFEDFPLPWRSDWKSGREWPVQHHQRIECRTSVNGSDVKSCWEPSRFHFALRLGQAFRLTNDARYVRHFVALLDDWRAANPLAFSVNWTSPLEVAIRAVNLAAALSLMAEELTAAERRAILMDLAHHGAFVRRNVEYTDIRGNHYTGNLVGLLVVGELLQGLVAEATDWLGYAALHIPGEILSQYAADGVNREMSIPYHRFVTEMFLCCALVLDRAETPLPERCIDRLASAVRFTVAYTRPDGSAPIIGDNDNARLLPMGLEDPVFHGHLVGLGRAVLGPLAGLGGGTPWEAFWVAADTAAQAPGFSAGQSFSEGGFHIGRVEDHHIVVDAGHVGLQGGGCHGHHDMLSFDLSLRGLPVVVDPGMAVYTGDLALRNRLRRTRAHNTAQVDGFEQGGFGEETWHMGTEAEGEGISSEVGEDYFRFQGSHRGYLRIPGAVRHHRLLLLTDQGLSGEDRFTAEEPGIRDIVVRFHLSPTLGVAPHPDGGLLVEGGGQRFLFTWRGEAPAQAVVESDVVSPGYGLVDPSVTIALNWVGVLPWTQTWEIRPL